MPAVRETIHGLGAEATPMSPAEFGKLLQQDSRRYAAIIKARDIKGD